MTVIAAFTLQNVPILFADLLTTGPQLGPLHQVTVPAIGNVEDFFGDSGWAIQGLQQKITLISPNCVVAWAGSWLGARVAIARLRTLAESGNASATEIVQYLSQEYELGRHPASFVGFTIEQEGVRQFQFAAEKFDSPTLGSVYLSGSGAPAIREFSELLSHLDWECTDTDNALMGAVSRALTLSGMLLQLEFRGNASASTIRNMFGGGYEIAVLANGRFHKVGDITFVFWEAGFTPDGVGISRPRLAIKHGYLGDHLLIRSGHFSSATRGDRPRLTDDQRHSVRPMFETESEPSMDDLSKISFQSRSLCHCIIVREQGVASRVYTLFQHHNRAEDSPMSFEDKNGQVVVSIQRELIVEFGRRLQRLRAAPTNLQNSMTVGLSAVADERQLSG